MIIFDLSQIMAANVATLPASELSLENLRARILNSLRKNIKKFSPKYGRDIVIALDSQGSWRRDEFPYYKCNRERTSTINWTEVYGWLNIIISELDTYFPYRVIAAQRAEADDIIGTLCHKFGGDDVPMFSGTESEPIIIVSGDKDFKQLQKYDNVRQWSPVLDKFLDCKDPEQYLAQHILEGDKGDGIPNILSEDDTFFTRMRTMKKKGVIVTELSKGRQTPLTEERIASFYSERLNCTIATNLLNNFERNERLIDLNNTPDEIKAEILRNFESQAGKGRSKMFDYFVTRKLKILSDSISDF